MQVMEASVKTDLPLSFQSSLCTLWKVSTVSTFQCGFNDRISSFIVIGPLQNHYSRQATVAWFALILYTTLYNLHINLHTVNTILHPVLACGGRNAVICGNSTCIGTMAMGRVGKWFPRKLFVCASTSCKSRLFSLHANASLTVIHLLFCLGWIYSHSGCCLIADNPRTQTDDCCNVCV